MALFVLTENLFWEEHRFFFFSFQTDSCGSFCFGRKIFSGETQILFFCLIFVPKEIMPSFIL